MQDSSQVSTVPPLPGPDLVAQINAALQAVGTDFAGPNDPAAIAWPYATWADTTTGLLKRRNDADTAWVTIGLLFGSAEWAGKAVGEIFYLRDDLAGVTVPPTNVAGMRFVKLTASDAYNTGVLTSESVTGSAPLVVATATISLTASPLNGRTINLINTERRVLRAGSSGTVQNDALQNITGSAAAVYRAAAAAGAGAISLATFGSTPAQPGTAGAVAGDNVTINFNAANSPGARTDTETRAKNIGVTAYMRIL